MTKFWLTTKSTTAALCLLGMGANTVLGMQTLALTNDGNDLDECDTPDAFAVDLSVTDTTDFDALKCDSSILEESQVSNHNDRLEFEEFSDPSWQEENARWDTADEPLLADLEAKWDNIPNAAIDAAVENSDSEELTQTNQIEAEISPDISLEEPTIPTETAILETERENVPDAAIENGDSEELTQTNQIEAETPSDISLEEPTIPTETAVLETQWENVPDAATENWDTPATITATDTEWDTVPDTTLKTWETSSQPEVADPQWENVPDAATENWETPNAAIADKQIQWENVRDLSETENVQPAIAKTQHEGYLEDDPQFKAILNPETAQETVAKLTPEDLIRDDRQIAELIAPTREQQQTKTTGLPPEEIMRVAENNTLSDLKPVESPPQTPLLDRLDTDLRRLRNQAEIVSTQSQNVPTVTPQPIILATNPINLNNDYTAISTQQWSEQLVGALDLENELSLKPDINFDLIAYSVNPQLFEQDLQELGLKIFETELVTGDAIASSLFFADDSFETFAFDGIEMEFDTFLADWEDAIASTDFTAFISEHLLTGNSQSFTPDLHWQPEDIFAIESGFEALPHLNFGNHPFEFGFKQDFLRASVPLLNQKSL